MAGSISLSIGPEARYYCRYHAQADRRDFDRITLKLNVNLTLVRHLQHMVSCTGDAHWRISTDHLTDREQAYSFHQIPKEEHLSHNDYVRLLNAELWSRVYHTRPIEPMTQEQKPIRRPSSWLTASAFLPTTTRETRLKNKAEQKQHIEQLLEQHQQQHGQETHNTEQSTG